MQSITNKNFGILIAYVLPGFVTLWGLSYRVPQLQFWIGASPQQNGTVGGFLYISLLAVTTGIVASTIRWLIIDTFHHRTGISKPSWDLTKLQANLQSYSLFEENHYRYYQFYANMLVASSVGYFSWRTTTSGCFQWIDFWFATLMVVLFLGSRDTLAKYYQRVGELLTDK